MSGFFWGGSENKLFPLGSLFDNDNETKLYDDRYEVFVNGTFAGHKTLLTQNDSVTDIDDFLRNQGFTSFTGNVDGDHYQIQAAEEERQGIQNALEVYLSNR